MWRWLRDPAPGKDWSVGVSHTQDELLVSVVARLGALNSMRDPRDLMEAVAGRRTAMISLDLPTNLQTIAGRLPHSEALATPSRMLEVATLYPYFRPFALSDRWDSVVSSVMTSSAPGLKLRLGLTCHGFGASMGFRFCYACSMEHWERYGAIAWTRANNLPEVVMCPVHRSRLVEGMKQSAMSFRQRIPVPDLRVSMGTRAPRNLDALVRFAELSRELLWSAREPVETGTRLRVLRDALRRRGFVRGQDQIRWAEVSSHLLERHGHYEDFPSERHLVTRRNGVLSWLPSVLSSRKSSHPVVNLLLIDALFDGLDDFFARVDADVGRPESEVVAPTPDETPVLDDPEWSRLRDRIRRVWIDLHESDPMLSTTKLRPRMEAEYAWLYRNDRDWIRAHSRGMPAAMRVLPTPRVDWVQRDREYTSKLMSTGNVLLSRGSGRPFTMTSLLKLVGSETTLRKHLHQLPNLREAIETLLAKSRQEYLLRRARRFVRH